MPDRHRQCRLQSGGDHGDYLLDADAWGGLVYRIIDRFGAPPEFVACQDFMTEPQILAKTGFPVAQHQEFTVDSYRYLMEQFPAAPWIPVLQGPRVEEYLEHCEMYEAAGVDLAGLPLVGVGSVCRLQGMREAGRIFAHLAERGLRQSGLRMWYTSLCRPVGAERPLASLRPGRQIPRARTESPQDTPRRRVPPVRLPQHRRSTGRQAVRRPPAAGQLTLFEAAKPPAVPCRPAIVTALPTPRPRRGRARVGADLTAAARLIAEHGLAKSSCAQSARRARRRPGPRARQRPAHGPLHPLGAVFLAALAAEKPRRAVQDPVQAGAAAGKVWERCDAALRFLADHLAPDGEGCAVERIAAWVSDPRVGRHEVLVALQGAARTASPPPRIPPGYVTLNPRRHRLDHWDIILVASSGGKDSQAMLDEVVRQVDDAGVPRSRIVVLHNDLDTTDSGESIEWPGTEGLAQEQAEHYGLRFVTLRRELGGLWRQLLDRGRWPSADARWCTSDQKTSQAMRFVTALVRELREGGLTGRPVRVLYCLGLRAQESTGRAGKPVIAVDRAASNGLRTVVRWSPIHHWSETQVWERIARTGVRYHWAYDAGMERLSCSLCVLGTHKDLVLAARLRRALAVEFAGAEQLIGHRFQAARSIASVLDEADALNSERGPVTWRPGDALRRHLGEQAAQSYLELTA